jgi:general secretion pathway protein M
MNSQDTLRYSRWGRALAAIGYGVAVLALFTAAILAVETALQQRRAVADAAALVAQLDRHAAAPTRPGASVVRGSPFLDGNTLTIAGAALLQRVADAVKRSGGNLLSSQVDVQGPHSAQGVVSVLASFDIESRYLQKLLYDLEAGMPFLYVDQLVVQSAVPATGSSDGRLHVLLSVSGQWQRQS